jgi:transcriptional regulator NrdR family protein
MQLRVIKADGSVEEYFHTKVIGAISKAFDRTGQTDIGIAEELADVVTYFLYHKQRHRTVTSDEIFSIIQAVLTAVGYDEAAIALSEYRFERRLRRCRVEVVSADIRELSDAEVFCGTASSGGRSRWDKSRIVAELMTKHGLGRQAARTAASMAEEKILNMGIALVPSSLVKQLVLGETAAVLQAQRELETV